MTKPELTLDPIKQCLASGGDRSLDLLVRVRVPETAVSGDPERPALNLALVIDRSGSMQGEPLNQAKASAKRIVDGLKPGDRVAVIAYHNRVETVCASTDATHKAEIRTEIDRIQCNGMTNLHGGWLAGAEQVAQHVSKTAINRVILLSDGKQNHGITDAEEIARQCGVMAEKGVETSTYGLGHNFNEDLMADMAAKGRGNAYYGETAEDLAPCFEAEFGILSQTVGKNVRLRLTPASNTSGVELLNGYRSDGAVWILPNLVAGAEVWAAVRLTPKNLSATDARRKLLSVEIAYDGLDGNTAHPLKADLRLPVVSPTHFDAADSDNRVAERIKEVEAAQIQLAAKQAARSGDWDRVDDAVSQLQGMAQDNAYVGEVASVLADVSADRDANLMSKELTFAAASMSTRYADLHEDASELAASAEFTARRGRQGRRS